MRLLTWNLAGYTGPTMEAQLARILEHEPEVLALQEVVRGSIEFWHEKLREHGYSVITSDLALLEEPGPYLLIGATAWAAART